MTREHIWDWRHRFAGARRRPGVRVGSVASSMLVVGGATAIGQGALVLVAPILSRLYDPADFGLLAVYVAALTVLVGLASLRYDFAIPIASDAAEAVHLVALSVILAAITSVAVGLGVLFLGASIASAAGAASIAPLLWLLPVALFVAAVSQAVASWAVFDRSFSPLGRMRATQGVAQGLVQVVLGWFHGGALGLIVGDFAARASGMGQLLRSVFESLRAHPLSRDGLERCLRERWPFARVMTVASLLSTLSLQAPFLLIPAFFDLDSSGQYFLAYRVLVLPAMLVGTAVNQVFFGEASFRRGDPENLHTLARDVTISLFVFSIPTYAMVAAAGPALFMAVFGADWSEAGRYAQIMAPWLVLWAVASPISSLLLVGRRERESLAFTAAELLVRVAALALGAFVGSLVIGVATLTVASVALNVSALWRFLRVASIRLRDLVVPAGRIGLLTLPSAGAVAIAGAVVPELVLPAALAGWTIAFGLAMRVSPEPRALLGGKHE